MPFIHQWIVPAINLVNVIKNFINNYNPQGNTPFDEVFNKFRLMLLDFFNNEEAKVEAFILKLIEAGDSLIIGVSCFKLPTKEEQVVCFLKWLNSQPQTIKEAMFNKLAGALAKADGAPGRQAHIDAMVQVAYNKMREEDNV
jgi:hypothetical protein